MSRTSAPDTRARILDAADRLLARHGYSRMTVDDLATEAGIGKGTVYLSFRSKEEVALACIDRMAARLLERLRAAAARPGPPAARLRELLVTRVMHRFDYAREHSASLDALLAAFRPALLERRAAHFEAEARVLAGVLRGGARAGALAARPALETARALVVATNALLPHSLSVRELGQRRAVAARAARIAGLLLAGVLRRGSPGSARRARPAPRRMPR